jgi:hypothetical protein
MTPLHARWACLMCEQHGDGPGSDLQARKHQKTSGHHTLTHQSDGSDIIEWAHMVGRIRATLADAAARRG